MQQRVMQSGPGALPARWRIPSVLRCSPATSTCRRLRVQRALRTDLITLPSAPPLRDDVSTVGRLPHQRSFDLEASTSEPAAASTAAASQQALTHQSGLDLGWLLQPKSTLLLGGLLGGLGFDASKPGSVLQAITVLALIVAVHEAGHFLAARLQGIRVTRFAVGFGPTLFKYQGGGVEYCLNAIPLGGYVAFPDDDPSALTPAAPALAGQGAKEGSEAGAAAVASTAAPASSTASASSSAPGPASAPAPATEAIRPDDPDLLKNRPIPQRALVISAGVIANVLFAYLVLLAQISTVGKAETAFLPGVRVVVPDTPAAAVSAAARAGLRTGDVILRIGDVTIPAGPSQVSASVAAIRSSPGREVEVLVQRGGGSGTGTPVTAIASSSSGSGQAESEGAGAAGGSSSSAGEVLSLRCTPDAGSDGQGRIGVQLTSNTFIMHTYPTSTGEVLSMTQSEFNRLAGTVLNGLKQIVTNFAAMSGQLSGPVAIVAAGSEVVRMDSAGLFQFAAIVNINLAAVNILPLPALDGGYLLLLGLEAARGGRKLPAGVEQGVMAGGFLLLTALGLGLVIRDTINLL